MTSFNHHISRKFAKLRGMQGLSLIELMISLAIGMIAVVFVMRTMIGFETNRRAGIGGSESMQNGVIAMLTMESDAAQAGWGLNHPQVSGCMASFSDTSVAPAFKLLDVGGTVNPTPLAPIVVKFNTDKTLPDTIAFYSGSSFAGPGALSLFSDAAAGTKSIDLNDPAAYGFNSQDVLVITQTNGKCVIVEAASAPTPITIGASTVTRVDLTDARFSPKDGLPEAYPSSSLSTRIFTLGNESDLMFHQWSIEKGRLMLHATDLAGATAGPQPAVSNIVSIKALYGFDTTNAAVWAPDSGLHVTQWAQEMVDADGDGAVGNPGDYQRIAAVRLAIVARSAESEKPDASGACDSTVNMPVVFERDLNGVSTIAVTVDPSVPGDSLSWKCYRYKTFEIVVPARNAGWRPGL